MKVLIVRSYGSVINTNMYNCQEIGLAKALSNRGIECGIVLFNGKEEDSTEILEIKDCPNIVIYRLKGISIAKHGIMKSINDIVEKYDVIWVNEFNQYTSYKLCKNFNKKTIIYHGPYSPTYSLIRWIRNYFCNKIFFDKKIANTTQVFTKSNLTKNDLLKLGFSNVKTIGVGLDINKIDIVGEKPQILKDIIKFKENKGVLLTYVGTIDPRKNTMMLLEILNKLKHNDIKVKLLMIGKGNEKYINNCFKYIEENNLEEYIIYQKQINQDQLKYIYENTNIFLLPTNYEIFGMVLLEAMYYKVPVITTKNGGSSTLIDDGKNGFICDGGVNEWINIIDKLISDPKYSKQIGQKANSTIVNNFTWDAIADTVIKNI